MKTPLFSITAKDCEWSYTKGSGSGGQKRNKTSSAVHCVHPPSGARGYSEASRSQADNKSDAFRKMVETDLFKKWLHMESLRISGRMELIEAEVDKQLTPAKLKVEVQQDGRWCDET